MENQVMPRVAGRELPPPGITVEDIKAMGVSEKLLDLANKISRVKRGSKNEIKPEHPEYQILVPICTDDMADVAMHLELRIHLTAEDIAPKCGRSVEETESLLWDIAMAGLAFVNEENGRNVYWCEIWVPGHMEMIVNNRENVAMYPVLGELFDLYGLRKGPMYPGLTPVGVGPMRVIPIETSIDGETRKASHEEVSGYLNEAHRFSVSDCACRTSREAHGEGCGHLKEDMCIQLDHAAEYYIKTGRGREISRDEAFDIIKRAEENGLMHSIPNLDGPGKTHAICNCCGCGCFSMRLGDMWNNPDMIRSNYVATVDADKCVGCGECVENCPSNALKLGKKLCAIEEEPEAERETPWDTEWGPDRWNPDYRTNREVVLDSGSSPCKAECPAHIGIQGYIKLASQGRYREALELIKHENPFPAVCGRVCPRYCESACTRGDVDEPIAIDDIKKFIADRELHEENRFVPEKRHHYDKPVAVIGAGPAGLSCAYYLALDGYRVTVFEKQKTLGGMLTLGIPSFRLEKDVINAEIDVLRELGVEFKTGVEIGKELSIDELRKQGFEAFYLAIGAQDGRMLGLEGEDADGVVTGVEFLRNVNLGNDVSLNGEVVVIGGGNVAIDVARTAGRTGSCSVKMFCLESREEMPALEEEIDEALEENISINNSWGPRRIIVENGRVTGVEFRKCVSVFGDDGRFSPVYDENETMIIEADHVLLSVGQAVNWGSMLEGTGIELNPNNTIKVDGQTYQTTAPDVFAGGDAVTGPKFAIDAIALGKEGAVSIHRFVNPGHDLVAGRLRRAYKAFDKAGLDLGGYDTLPRQNTPNVDGMRGTLTEEQVARETERCLGCGVTVVDEFMCVGCGQCTTKCKFEAISLEKRYDVEGYELEDLKSVVVKHVLKRKVRMMIKKIKKNFSRR